MDSTPEPELPDPVPTTPDAVTPDLPPPTPEAPDIRGAGGESPPSEKPDGAGASEDGDGTGGEPHEDADAGDEGRPAAGPGTPVPQEQTD
ncbi:hypothetical protein [Streptomyces omiyaensis]|uniref:hypothetical protein n=1 Tax=Streptomyces omiyaensis TaxID=68247 RepID=UPI001675F7FF|nr:hypothetical protein [Streptomyces omiyaensis]